MPTWIWFERLRQDLRFAGRMLWRSPGFTAVALCTLALGIGATTAMFTVVNTVVLRALPFPESDRLVMIWERQPNHTGPNVVQTQNFLDWHARNRSFDGLAALMQLPITIGGAEADQVTGLVVTGDFFRVLDVPLLLGRGIRPGEDRSGGPRTVVLSHTRWVQRHGARADVIGQQISINGRPTEIIGVTRPGFAFPGLRAELFVPLQINPANAPRDGRNYRTVARLRPGVTIDAARTEMAAIQRQIALERPRNNEKWGTLVVPLHEQAVGDVRLALVVLFGAVVCVLLIACVNIANLLSMRAAARAREITVRLALGAGQGRVVQQLLVESVLLASLGGALGLALAYAGVPAIVSLFPPSFPLPRAEEIGVDGRVLGFTLGVSVAAGLLFGLIPALQVRRRNLAAALHGSGRSVTGSNAALRGSLVVAEVTLAVVLVIGAGLMIRSLVRLYRVDPGFDAERVLTMRMLLLIPKYGPNIPRRAALVDQILARVRALPQVTAASTVHFLPLSGLNSGTGYYRADRPPPEPGGPISGGGVSVVSSGYFRAMNIPLLAGRDFDQRDTRETPRVAIVNHVLAQRFFPGESPIGKRLRVMWSTGLLPPGSPDPEYEIVGIAGDVRHNSLRSDADPTLFLANPQEPNMFVSIVVRTHGDPLAVAAAVRREIRAVDPDQGVSDVQTMETIVADAMARPRLQTLLLGMFGGLALVMACVGLYGLLSYSVEQRRREMGVRLALGAAPGSLLRLVVGEGLRLTAIGLVGGLAAAFVLSRYLSTLLYDVQPRDLRTFATVAAMLLLVATAACWVPARRATRVDPASILRDE